MSARRPVSAILALLCVLACALVAGAAPAGAATQFGSSGSGAGQFRQPWGVAVDQASGDDVYVADTGNKRIDVFEASGKFVMAWGWGVLNGAPEPQTCTASCQVGISGGGAGQLGEPLGIAVDNDPLSPSYGDVYVVNNGKDFVEKFDSSGKYLSTIGEEGTGDGQFSNTRAVAVGPEGRVYVGDTARVEVFDSSGVWLESISLAALSGTGGVRGLAVDASGDVFVKDDGAPGVHELEPDGTERAQFDAGSTTVGTLTVDGSGDLFVGESSVEGSPGTFRVLEYSPSGSELASFDNESALRFREGIAFASVLGVGELYVTSSVETFPNPEEADVTVVPVPVSGPPVIESGSASVTPGQRGSASAVATIDAQGNATSYHVEYVDEEEFKTSGYGDALSTPEVLLGSKFEEVPVTVALSGLVPGDTYHYRFVATSSVGSEAGPDQTFTEIPPALIGGPWAASVTSTSATFAAEIDPLGLVTEYRLEYGTTTAYGETLSGTVGEGEGYVPVSFHRQDLSPGTIYHYRVVVHNEVGSFAGPDRTFTTQIAGGQELSLPDGRAWELVSPVDKKGALIGPVDRSTEPVQAASDGSAIAYSASEPLGQGLAGHFVAGEIMSKRDSNGWSSEAVSASNALPPEGELIKDLAYGSGTFQVFSTDLSVGLYEPGPETAPPPQSPEATERTLYLRDSASGAFLPLETKVDIPSDIKFGDEKMQFLAGTPDLSHVIFGSAVALTAEAEESASTNKSSEKNLYEWSAGRLQLVNITPSTPESPNGTTEPGAHLGSFVNQDQGMTARALSTDGRWVVWAHGELTGSQGQSPVSLYARDMVEKRTFKLGGEYPRFETMSSDGSKIFFVETKEGGGGDLYVFDTETGTQADLTANHGMGESSAGVQDAVMGASEDGSYVYFVATGVLASGAVSGADNVYLLHDTASGWVTTFIATLSGEDSKSWRGSGDHEAPTVESSKAAELRLVSSRVSPNGHYLAFMSERSLTGYDNLDAVSGQPDEEVYLYDAVSDRLVCASCDPTGARPVGVPDYGSAEEPLLADLESAWTEINGSGNHWLAGSVPGWQHGIYGVAPYQPRYLSDSGRLFFDSPDALVPQDINGLEDVYQYELPANGETAESDSCTTESATFSERSGGCVSLISSGQSASESAFVDASENGDDVFFDTTSRLTEEDYDTSYDIYDAHVCSAEAPCRTEPVLPPPCTSGDSCKPAPSPQPEIFGAAPSATFSGIGNVVEEVKPSVVKRKAKSKHKPKAKHNRKVKRKRKTGSRMEGSHKISRKAGRRS
jgi:Tol biopolymer transport system component